MNSITNGRKMESISPLAEILRAVAPCGGLTVVSNS
jgi:hypothetical protein